MKHVPENLYFSNLVGIFFCIKRININVLFSFTSDLLSFSIANEEQE